MPSIYKIITKEKDIDKLITYCKQTGYASFDFETSGHEFHSPLGYPTILGISFQPGSSYIVPLGHFDSPFKDNYVDILQKISKGIFEDPNIVKIAYNAKFEYVWLKKYNCKIVGRFFDAMLAKYLLNEERPNDLKSQVSKYIPEFANYQENYDGYKLPWDQKPLEGLSKYCGLDCDNTLRLMLFFENQLINNKLYPLFRNMLMMGTRVLGDSEFDGMPVNKEYLEGLMVKYEELIRECDKKLRFNNRVKRFEKWQQQQRIDKLIAEIELELENLYEELDDAIKEGNTRLIGSKKRSIKSRELKIDKYIAKEFTTQKELKILEPINFGSPAQMGELFFTSPKGFKFKIVKYTTDKKTKQDTDNPSTDESVLLELAKKDKTGFCDTLLEYRGLTTLYGTFIKGMYERLSTDSKVHGRFLLHGCVTGDTKILCDKGDITIRDICPEQIGEKNIEHLKLKTLSHEGTWEYITHSINKGPQKVYKITTLHGDILKCTEEHKLFTIKGMKKVKDIVKNNIPIIMNNVSYLKEVGLEKLEKGYELNDIIYKEIPGYPGYLATNTGKIYSIKIPGGQGALDYNNPHEMITRNRKGYDSVGLRLGDGKRYQRKVSRLVYLAFKGNIPEGLEVDHIDHNRVNNHIDNLQLLTKSENIKKNFKNLRTAFSKGSINGYSKLDTLKVGNIIYDLSKGLKQQEVSEKYDISQKQISRIKNKEAWSNIYITHIYDYEYIGEDVIYDLSINHKHSYTTNSNFISANTVTGRLSSQDPNLQNIPRDTTSSDIKQMFIPPPGYLLLQLDYSQAELRVMAAQAGEKTMIKWFKEGKDIHLASALKKYNLDDQYDRIAKILDLEDEKDPEFKIWKVRRKQAKTINFGIIYGQGANKLMESLECSLEEAKQFLRDFDKTFPKVAAFVKKQHRTAHEKAYVKNVFGRKRRLWDIDSTEKYLVAQAERQAVNAPIQGAASDYALFSSILIWEKSLHRRGIEIDKLTSDMVNVYLKDKDIIMIDKPQCYTVHDSLGFFIKPQFIHDIVPKLEKICANPETMEWFGFQIDDVIMKVDFEVSAESWGKLRKYDPKFDYTTLL